MGMGKEMWFALSGFGTVLLMVGAILGTELLGWPVQNTLWWVALAAIITHTLLTVWEYLSVHFDPDA
jgi:hypothetical protein